MAADERDGGQRAGLRAQLAPLVALLRPHRRVFAAAVAAGVAHQLVVLAVAGTGAWVVGRAVTGASAAELHAGIVALGALVAPLALLPWVDSQLAHLGAFRVLVTVRRQLFDAVERLAPGGLVRRRAGDLGSAAVADVEVLEGFFAHTLSPVVVAATVPPAAVAALAVIRWELALALAPALAALATVPRWLRRRAEAEARRMRAALGELSADVVDSVQGLRELLANGAERRQLDKLAEREATLSEAKLAHARRAGAEGAATDALSFAGLLAVLLTGAHLVGEGALPPALLPVAVVLALASFVPVAALVDTLRDLHLVLAAADRIGAILASPPPVADDVGAQAPPSPVAPRVAFEDVSFRYPGAAADAVAGVSFTVGEGESVALVGHSGAGKTTCAQLLLRFWDPGAGRVTIGGHDVAAMPQSSVRDLVAHVPQDVHLFNASIADNIRMARPGATDAEVAAAARAAHAHEFIRALPGGYGASAGELGGRLSGGQRQRIAIARALLRDAPVIVLDEAASNLDAESEDEVAAALAALRPGRAMLVIAHRLSTIRNADRVVVLEAGRVVEAGAHVELLARGGAYSALVGPQVELAEVGQ